MTEEEAKAYADLKDQLAQKEQRIQELEGLLVGALLRIEELERRVAKDSHNSSLPVRPYGAFCNVLERTMGREIPYDHRTDQRGKPWKGPEHVRKCAQRGV